MIMSDSTSLMHAQTAEKTSENKSLADLPEWNLQDLYPAPDCAEFARDLEQVEKDAKAFAAEYQGKLADLAEQDGAAVASAISAFERMQDVMGRLGAYAMLRYTGNNADPERAKFFGDTREALTRISTELLFSGLELNRIDDDVLEKALAAEVVERVVERVEGRLPGEGQVVHDVFARQRVVADAPAQLQAGDFAGGQKGRQNAAFGEHLYLRDEHQLRVAVHRRNQRRRQPVVGLRAEADETVALGWFNAGEGDAAVVGPGGGRGVARALLGMHAMRGLRQQQHREQSKTGGQHDDADYNSTQSIRRPVRVRAALGTPFNPAFRPPAAAARKTRRRRGGRWRTRRR